VKIQSDPKHPSEIGLREKHGKWEYRFKLNGKPYSRVTDLEAVPENVLEAQQEKAAHMAELQKGKKVIRQISVPLNQAIPKFMAWYRSEHGGKKCGWAAGQMSSFQLYFEVTKCPLNRIGPAELEDFKMWRRENKICDNTIRLQLIVLGEFFRYGRKQGWLKGDPFAKGEDDEVKIPSQKASGVMYVLSPEEEARYLAVAREESMDLFDIATIMKEQGPRPAEVMSLQQSHIDLFSRSFTIWDNSAEGKSKNAHRKLRMTDETFRVFARRLKTSGMWVFPSPKKNKGHRTTVQKSHEFTTRGRENKQGEYEGGCRIECRLYDMRHTFATRFALAGGALPTLAKILGHSDLSRIMRYVHPSQADMDRAMEWYNTTQKSAPELEDMLVSYDDGTEGVARPPFGPPATSKVAQTALIWPNSAGKVG
jgi:integrase